VFDLGSPAQPWAGSLPATFAPETHGGAALASQTLLAPPAACRNLTGSLREEAFQEVPVSSTEAAAGRLQKQGHMRKGEAGNTPGHTGCDLLGLFCLADTPSSCMAIRQFRQMKRCSSVNYS